VVGLVDQKTGEARAFAVDRAHVGNVRDILVRHASRRSTLVTDEAGLYHRSARNTRRIKPCFTLAASTLTRLASPPTTLRTFSAS